MKGRLIVIEGLDGSGKATQTGLLCEALEKRGAAVRKVSFPDYSSDSSALVKMYLNGEFGHDPASVNAYAASTFYAVDRYASYKKDWGGFYEAGGVILADRYTTSNAVHQCCKLPEEEWDAYLSWLFDFEYRLMGIPAPYMVIYLQVDVDESQQLMSGRYAGHEEKKDIHESNVAYLNRARRAADYCGKALGWETVRCCREGTLRAVEDIHAEIMSLVGGLDRMGERDEG